MGKKKFTEQTRYDLKRNNIKTNGFLYDKYIYNYDPFNISLFKGAFELNSEGTISVKRDWLMRADISKDDALKIFTQLGYKIKGHLFQQLEYINSRSEELILSMKNYFEKLGNPEYIKQFLSDDSLFSESFKIEQCLNLYDSVVNFEGLKDFITDFYLFSEYINGLKSGVFMNERVQYFEDKSVECSIRLSIDDENYQIIKSAILEKLKNEVQNEIEKNKKITQVSIPELKKDVRSILNNKSIKIEKKEKKDKKVSFLGASTKKTTRTKNG